MSRLGSPMWIVLTGLALTLGSGCAAPQKGAASIQSVDGLVANVERVHLEAEVGLDRAREAMDSLRAILRHDFQGDAGKAYSALGQAIERSKAQSERFEASLEPMNRMAGEVFANWTRDLEAMSSPNLRQKSEERRQLTQQRYEALVTTTEPVALAFKRFNLLLRDHSLFLGHDFNAEAIGVLGSEMETLRKQYEVVALRVERLGDAAREYVRTSAPIATLQPSTPTQAPRR